MLTTFHRLAAQVEYSFQRIDINSGLTGNIVNSLARDDSGFLWIATDAGVQRFDMYDFKQLPEISDGYRVFIDRNQRTWVSTGERILVWDKKKNVGTEIPVMIDGIQANTFSEPTISQDQLGRVLLKTKIPGLSTNWFLLVHDNTKNQFRPLRELYPKTDRIFYGVHVDRLGQTWFHSNDGFVHYDPANNFYSYFGRNPRGLALLNNRQFVGYIHRFGTDSIGNFFFVIWPPNQPPVFYLLDQNSDVKVSISHQEIRDVLVDSENNIWLVGSEFQKLNSADGTLETIKLPDDIKMINAICQTLDGNIWLGTYRGLLVMDPRQPVVRMLHKTTDGESSGSSTMSFLKTHDGFLLAGSYEKGIFIYDQSLKPVSWFRQKPSASLRTSDFHLIWSLFEDSNHNVWVGRQNGRLTKIDGLKGELKVYSDESFNHETIRSIAEDHYGNIWFGTQRGKIVKRSANGHFQQILTDQHQGIVTDLEISGDTLWAAAGIHLLAIDVRKNSLMKKFALKIPGTKDVNKQVFFHNIVSVSKDRLEAGTSDGFVAVILPDSIYQTNSLRSGIVSVQHHMHHRLVAIANGSIGWHSENGFRILDRGNFFQMNSSAVTDRGVILFGSELGFSVVKTDNLDGDARVADSLLTPQLTAFRVNGRDLNEDSLLHQKIILGPDERTLTVAVSSMMYGENQNVVYHFMLKKNGRKVAEVDNSRVVTFTQLTDGTYHLELFYTLGGVARSFSKNLEILILPPFYKTVWFAVLLTLVIMSIAFFIAWTRYSKKRDLEIMRERISRDLHDDMGSYISTISILSNVAKSSAGSQSVQVLQKIGDLSIQVMDTMDEIVWSINPRFDTAEEIIKRMRLLGGQLFENTSANFHFIVEGDPRRLSLDLEKRNDFYLFYKECLTNIIKHARCTVVRCCISIGTERVKLSIEDDGVGFERNNLSRENGLLNLETRANSLRAVLEITSIVNKGTRIVLSFAVRG